MGYMIEISESKLDKMSDYVEDALHSMGRLMTCIEGISHPSMGERNDEDEEENYRYGSRSPRMGYRSHKDWDDDDDEDMMGERRSRGRSRDYRGRYR